MDRLETFLADLLSINPNIDIGLIESAYKKAEVMHEGQNRKSGEPYIIHPVEVAKILAELGMDEFTVAAGLLHDAVEDTPYSIDDVKADFGTEIALLVDGVTKLGSLVFDTKEERQAENLRKMFLAMSKDIRVLIIKLADRLHNLRTINYMNKDQIHDKCRETLEIYAPLASRLGIYSIKFELEDISLKYLDPDAYYQLVTLVSSKKEERQMYIDDVITEVHKALGELGIDHEIVGRSKHFYSIYKKMKYQDKQIDEIFDLNAVRILVNSVKDCYAVLGSVHTLWKPLPGRFKDYIAMPKPNLYQSLHTTVLGKSGNPFEIQIRTWEMHHVAEYGIAAHWKYKEGVLKDQEDVKLAWLRQTLEWNQDMNDPREFMEALKMDLFSNQVFVFTPKGDVMELPAGSTPLDFAFKIHTDVGVKCIGAKVDAKMVPIDYELQNGEIVDIVTQNNAKGPSIDWLQIAKSSNAKSKIRQWLKKQDRSNSIDKGRDLLEKAIRRKGWSPQEYNRNAWILKIAKQMGFKTSDELYTSIANGGIVVSKVLVQLEMLYNHEIQHIDEPSDTDTQIKNIRDKLPKSHSRADGVGRVKVQGINNLMLRLARCCSPVPGDEIVGYITKGRGVTVHRKDCTNITSMHSEEDLARLMTVDWETGASGDSFDADIIVVAEDRKGLFSDVSRKCTDLDVNITGVNSKTETDKTVVMQLTLQINSIAHLQRVIRNIRRVESVTDVSRARGN